MSQIDYITVFDASQAGFKSWSFPAFGLIFVAIGLILPRLIKTGIFPRHPPGSVWFARLWLGFAIFWTVSVFCFTFGGWIQARDSVASGRAHYVEGPVENFVPMPYRGHAAESFTVEGIPFHYSDYEVTAGFNNSSSHGGPVRQGLPVRIWYTGNTIVKLEVPKDWAPDASTLSVSTPRKP